MLIALLFFSTKVAIVSERVLNHCSGLALKLTSKGSQMGYNDYKCVETKTSTEHCERLLIHN